MQNLQNMMSGGGGGGGGGGDAQGQGQLDPKDEAPWYMKYGVRGLGTVAGGLAMLLGAIDACLNLITLNPICAIFNIWQVVVGFGVVTIESPCCCFFVDHVQAITARVESKPLYMKAAVYVGAPLPCILFCFGFYTMFGSGLIVVTGVMYGFMALGKKASREEMARNAQSATGVLPFHSTSTQDKAYLVENLRDPTPNPPQQFNGYQQQNLSKLPSRNSPQPPPYTDLQETTPVGWDTPFKPTTTSNSNNYSQSASVTMGSNSTNPVPSDPYNPFQ